MREAKSSRRAGYVRDNTSRQRLVERLEDLVLRDGIETRKCAERELATEHGGEDELAIALVRQVPESPGNDVPNGLWDRDSGLGVYALDGEQAHDLAHEQRVTLGFFVQRGSELRRGELGRGQLDVLGDVLLAQPSQRDPPRHRFTDDLGQRRRQRLP